MTKTEGLPYDQAAEQRILTTTEWFCKTCGKRWFDCEDSARRCCTTAVPCSDCGKSIPNRHGRCVECQWVLWTKREAIPWDGEFPIANWEDSKFFFYMEELLEYLYETSSEVPESTQIDFLKDMMLTSCEPMTPRQFRVADLFDDCLGEEQEPPENDVLEKQVNDWLNSLGTLAYCMTGKRLDIDHVARIVEQEIAKRGDAR